MTISHAAVIVDPSNLRSGEPQKMMSRTMEHLSAEDALENPESFLPDTFRLDLGREKGAQPMNPLLRKFYYRLGQRDIDGALDTLADLQETQFLNPKLYTTQAQLLIFDKRYDEARAATRLAIRYDQSYMRAHKMLAFINMLDGEYDVAIKDLLAALQYDENDTEVLKLAAFGFMNKKDFSGATRIFAHIARLTPKEPQAHADLGNAWLRQGKNNYATMALEKAAQLSPESPIHFTNLATAYVAVGELQKALETYAMALEKDPFYSPALSNLGALIYNDGQRKKGLQLLIKACDIDISSHISWNNLVLVLSREFPVSQSHVALRTADGMIPYREDRIYYNWGIRFARTQNTSAALSHFVKALQTNPADPEFMNDLGSIFAGTGGISLARVMYRRALFAVPTFDAAQANLIMVEKQLAEQHASLAPVVSE